MVRLVISLILSMGLAYAADCESWTAWQPLGEPYNFEGAQFVDELRERECRSGNETWTEVMSRSRSVAATPMYIIYGDAVTGPRVVGLNGTEQREGVEALLSDSTAPFLILVTPHAVERYAELLQDHEYLVVGREGVMIGGGGELSLEALGDALAAFVMQAR